MITGWLRIDFEPFTKNKTSVAQKFLLQLQTSSVFPFFFWGNGRLLIQLCFGCWDFCTKFVPLINCFPIHGCTSNRNMDAQAKKKALFRAKLNAQKKKKRIESPLVRLVLGAHHVLFHFTKLHEFACGILNLVYAILHQLLIHSSWLYFLFFT